MLNEIRVGDGVSQREVRLGELGLPDLVARIVDVTGARVAGTLPSASRASLIHLGNVISIDSRNWRHDGSRGPFLSVSSEGDTQPEIPTLLNPLVTITPESVIFTEINVSQGSNVVHRCVEIFRGGLVCKSSVLAKKD